MHFSVSAANELHHLSSLYECKQYQNILPKLQKSITKNLQQSITETCNCQYRVLLDSTSVTLAQREWTMWEKRKIYSNVFTLQVYKEHKEKHPLMLWVTSWTGVEECYIHFWWCKIACQHNWPLGIEKGSQLNSVPFLLPHMANE